MSGERTEMRRPAVKMAAAMMPAAEMVPVTATTMTTAVMAAAAATTVAAAMAAFSNRKVRHRKRRGENTGSNSQSEFRHGASLRCTSHHRWRHELDGTLMNVD